MAFQFYGWQTASVTDDHGLTPREYYLLLSRLWCADTCAPRMRGAWTEENKTLGQCSITAFLMQDIYGGKVYGVPLGDGNFHCFNDVNGCVFDLTSEQFGSEKLDYTHCPEQDRRQHFAKEEKYRRYLKLRDALMKARPRISPMDPAHIETYGRIYAAAFQCPPWNDPWDPKDAEKHVRESMDSAQSYGLEISMDGEVAGFISGSSCLFHDGRAFEIQDLAIDPAWQGRKYASMLLERCKFDLAAQGIRRLMLITSGDGFLPEFYAQHGFRGEDEVILMGMQM